MYEGALFSLAAMVLMVLCVPIFATRVDHTEMPCAALEAEQNHGYCQTQDQL